MNKRLQGHARSSAGTVAWAGYVLVAGVGMAGFALTHPFGLWPVLAALFVYALVIGTTRTAWLLALPALLPVVDLVPWTGMIFWTEADALILCTMLVGGLREALRPSVARTGAWQFGLPQWVVVLPLALSYLLSTHWAALAGLGHDPDLLSGYDSPLNGVRLAKGFFLPLALLPLAAAGFRGDARAGRMLIGGLVSGLMLVSLAALWERWAFPGLSDFASDYRTTALFWEMHVGGAQLDGWLVSCLPALLGLMLSETRPVRLIALAMMGGLAAYAVFTTFSRGLYVGTVLSGIVLLGATFRDRWSLVAVQRPPARSFAAVTAWIGLAGLFGWAVMHVFPTGGYRGLAALSGLAMAVYLLGPCAAGVSVRGGLLASGIWLAACALSLFCWATIAKGVYLIYGVSFAVALLLAGVQGWRPVHPWAALAALGWLGVNGVLVGVHWGGKDALIPALAGVASLMALLAMARWPAMAWQPGWRPGFFLGAAFSTVALLALTLNTFYAASRLGTVVADLEGRKVHWARGFSLVSSPDQWLGIGTGRFAAEYFWRVPDNTIPGNHHLGREGSNDFLRLGGARYPLGFGELYRVSQRIDGDLVMPAELTFQARAPEADVDVHVEICRKHLLYEGGCTTRQVPVRAGTDWSAFSVSLPVNGLGTSPGFPPKLTMFSIADATRGQLVEIDDLRLIDRSGQSLLRNGDFSAGAARWFFSSDRHHLPWHAKSLWLHYWVEQGWLGLFGFSTVLIVAVFRLTFGRARFHPLAPPLLAGVVGLMAVGVFDSLVDAPRLATLIFLLLFVALGLRGEDSERVPGPLG